MESNEDDTYISYISYDPLHFCPYLSSPMGLTKEYNAKIYMGVWLAVRATTFSSVLHVQVSH